MKKEERKRHLTDGQYLLYKALPESFDWETARDMSQYLDMKNSHYYLLKKSGFFRKDNLFWKKVKPIQDITHVLIGNALYPVEKALDSNYIISQILKRNDR